MMAADLKQQNNAATTKEEIVGIVARQRSFFKTGATKSYEYRIENLNKLKTALVKYERELLAALKQDLGKPEFEAYLSETGFSLFDISETISGLKTVDEAQANINVVIDTAR